jgi:DNA-directed RNA polymerase specialized sigma24 family protein
MGVDESFAAYAAARRSMLYRLATLLAGGQGAEHLTRAALVRAYVVWPEVQESGEADAHVKRILARTAVKEAPVGDEPDGEGDPADDRAGTSPNPDRDKLWAGIRALLPRQRAILVLRHYERLSDAEIAGALGCSTGTVAAESLALETGIDLTDLREELFLRSESARVPHPALDSLVAAGQEERRRHRRQSWRWAAGGAVAVVLGLAVVSLVQGLSDGQSARSGPASSTATVVRFLSALPVGAPSRIAYSSGASLRLGDGREVPLADQPATIVQTMKWLYVAYLSGEIVRVDPVTGELRTVARHSNGELVTDPAGEHVAWLAAGTGEAVVVLRTVADWTVQLSDEQAFPATPRCCDNPFVVHGITPDGQVVGSLPATQRAWIWTAPDAGTTTAVREIRGLGNGVITEVSSTGVVVHRLPFQYAVGRVEDDGLFVRTAALTAIDADFADPLGERAVYADEDGEIRVRDFGPRGRSRRGGQDVRMLLPTIGDGFSAVRWEDNDHVLLELSDASVPQGALVRCAVDSGACEVAARFSGPHVIAK